MASYLQVERNKTKTKQKVSQPTMNFYLILFCTFLGEHVADLFFKLFYAFLFPKITMINEILNY